VSRRLLAASPLVYPMLSCQALVSLVYRVLSRQEVRFTLMYLTLPSRKPPLAHWLSSLVILLPLSSSPWTDPSLRKHV
jgi:hypothetical protein